MQSRFTYKQYNLLVLLLTPVLVSLMLIVIITTTDEYNDSSSLIQKASEWQTHTKGIAAISDKLSSKLKYHSGSSYIKRNTVNTIIFGSSTVMGIRSNIFHKPYIVYNYSTKANPLNKSLGEINFFLESNENIRWVIVGLDYSLGFPFHDDPILKHQVGEANTTNEKVTFWEKIQDAVTLDRLKITLLNLWVKLTTEDEPYPCPKNDGIGKDFGITRTPKMCDGFRYDGSATFHYRHMTSSDWKRKLSDKGLKRYSDNLLTFSGEINNAYLMELAKIETILKARSGQLITLFPPLMPEAEEYLLKSPAGINLRRLKKEFPTWAKKNGIVLIDAGKSEKYGCLYNEFYDQHHALDGCYRRIFQDF